MKYTNIALTIFLLCMPSLAYASGLTSTAYIMGLSTSGRCAHQSNVESSGLPMFCAELNDFEEYKACRIPSASTIPWVVNDVTISFDEKNEVAKEYYETIFNRKDRMRLSEFLKREWNSLQKAKGQ